VARGEAVPADLDEESFSRYLYLPDLAPVDLLIRTSGEQRISNFCLWQLAYAEIHITPALWPDFGAEISTAPSRTIRDGSGALAESSEHRPAPGIPGAPLALRGGPGGSRRVVAMREGGSLRRYGLWALCLLHEYQQMARDRGQRRLFATLLPMVLALFALAKLSVRAPSSAPSRS